MHRPEPLPAAHPPGQGPRILTTEAAVVRIIAGLVSGPHQGFARRFAERLYERHRFTETGGIWIDA